MTSEIWGDGCHMSGTFRKGMAKEKSVLWHSSPLAIFPWTRYSLFSDPFAVSCISFECVTMLNWVYVGIRSPLFTQVVCTGMWLE